MIRQKNVLQALICAVLLLLTSTGFSQDATSNWFSTDGEVFSSKVNNGRLFLGGDFDWIGQRTGNFIAFDNETSELDFTFPDFFSGSNVNTQLIEKYVADGQGGWYILGRFDRIGTFPVKKIAHLNADYSVDNDFTFTGLGSSVDFKCLKLHNDYLYIGGTFTYSTDNVQLKNLLRINLQTNTVDDSWVPNPSGAVYAIDCSGEKIIFGGAFITVFDQPAFHLAATEEQSNTLLSFPESSYAPDNICTGKNQVFVNDNTSAGNYIGKHVKNHAIFNFETKEYVADLETNSQAVIVTSDGAGGWFIAGNIKNASGIDKNGIAYINSDMTVNVDFTSNIEFNEYQSIYNDLVCDDDYLYVAGIFILTSNGVEFKNLVRFHKSNGLLDETWQPNPSGEVNSVLITDNEIIVGGSFEQIAGQEHKILAALSKTDASLQSWAPVVDGSVVSDIAMYNDKIIIAGNLYNVDSGESWVMLSIDQNELVEPLPVDNYVEIDEIEIIGTTILVNGYFSDKSIYDIRGYSIENKNFVWNEPTVDLPLRLQNENIKIAVDGTRLFAALVHKPNIGYYNSSVVELNPTTGEQIGQSLIFNDKFSDFAVASGQVYISGGFDFVNFEQSKVVGIELSTNNIAAYNEINGIVANDMLFYNDQLFVAGKPSSGFAGLQMINPETREMPSWEGNVEGHINDISIDATNNRLYLGGEFTSFFNNTVRNVAALNLNDFSVINWNPKPEDEVECIAINKNQILMSGSFVMMNAENRENLAVIDLADNTLLPTSVDFDSSAEIYDLEVNGNTIYAAGRLSKVNGTVVKHFAMIDFTNSTLIETNIPQFSNYVRSLQLYDEKIFAGGAFTDVDNVDRQNIACLNLDGSLLDWKPNVTKSTTYSSQGVYDILIDGDILFAVGETKLNSDSYLFSAFSLIDGSLLKSLGKGSYDQALSLTKFNDKLLMGGDFSDIDDVDLWNNALIDTENYEITGQLKGIDFNVDKCFSTDDLLFVAGRTATGVDYGKILIFDAKSDSVKKHINLLWNSSSPTVHSLEVFDNYLYVSGKFNNLGYNNRISNIAKIELSPQEFKPSVISHYPYSHAQKGTLELTIKGRGFEPNTTCQFIREGYDAIPINIQTITSERISATVNSELLDIGKWNIEVLIPSNEVLTIDNAMDIIVADNLDLWVNIVGSSEVLIGPPSLYSIAFGNNSNVDAYNVPLYIAFDARYEYVLHVNIIRALSEGIDEDVNQADPFIVSTEFMGEHFDNPVRIYPLTIPIIPANSSTAFRLVLTNSDYEEKLPIRVAIYAPMTDDIADLDAENKRFSLVSLAKCAYDVVGTMASFTPGVGCAKSAFDVALDAGYKSYKNKDVFTAGNMIDAVISIGLGCAGLGGFDEAANLAINVVGAAKGYDSAANGSCGDVFDHDRKDPDGKRSKDPNGKYGPGNPQGSHYLNIDKDKSFSYQISFENMADATAPAHIVRVVDTLDVSKFKVETFEFFSINLVDTMILLPNACKKFDITIDLQEYGKELVHITGTFDDITGITEWIFTTIDASTLLPTYDVYKGFLPPNDEYGSGDGSVLFNIELKDNLNEDEIIANGAIIWFDWNDPIYTPVWSNSIDNYTPTSTMEVLAIDYASYEYEVSWNGIDDKSGIMYYNIFVTPKDGEQTLWKSNTTETSAEFIGEAGMQYCFTSIAVDSAYNVEPLMDECKASIQIITSIEANELMNRVELFENQPNPSNGITNISYYIPRNQSIKLEMIDITGRVTVLQNLEQAKGKHTFELKTSAIARGIYTYRLITNNSVLSKKMIIAE